MKTAETTLAREPVGLAALDLAIVHAGGLTKFAELVGVSYQNVQSWRQSGRGFATPAPYCLKIEQLTGVSKHDLRPDVFGSGGQP